MTWALLVLGLTNAIAVLVAYVFKVQRDKARGEKAALLTVNAAIQEKRFEDAREWKAERERTTQMLKDAQNVINTCRADFATAIADLQTKDIGAAADAVAPLFDRMLSATDDSLHRAAREPVSDRAPTAPLGPGSRHRR